VLEVVGHGFGCTTAAPLSLSAHIVDARRKSVMPGGLTLGYQSNTISSSVCRLSVPGRFVDSPFFTILRMNCYAMPSGLSNTLCFCATPTKPPSAPFPTSTQVGQQQSTKFLDLSPHKDPRCIVTYTPLLRLSVLRAAWNDINTF